MIGHVRRLTADDAAAFHALRLEGFARHPREFRFAPEDEADLSLDRVRARLVGEFVVGGFVDGELVGIGGLARETCSKLSHKGLLWGMYVREVARGTGLAAAIVERIMEHARREGVEQILLTVAAHNLGARRLYERWGFTVYGIEPRSFRVGDEYVDEVLMAKPLS
jgi:RimJ/RimL family protein N-acetyltransferase